MTQQQNGRVWLLLGGVTLAVLWTGVLLQAMWVNWAGMAFLGVPYIAALVLTLPKWRADRTSSLCALALFLLFCLTWLF